MQTAPVRKGWTGKRHGSSVLFTHHDPGCTTSRRVPYWRPRDTPLYEERYTTHVAGVGTAIPVVYIIQYSLSHCC